MIPSIHSSSPLYVVPLTPNEPAPELTSPKMVSLLIGIIIILTVIAVVTSVKIFISKKAIWYHL